jgi:hypothetical protein
VHAERERCRREEVAPLRTITVELAGTHIYLGPDREKHETPLYEKAKLILDHVLEIRRGLP